MNHAFPEKQKKSGGKMHQKWKEMTGEFSKKSKTNTEKTYEKYGKSSYVFWKNSNVFQEISYVFSETSEILSQSEKSDFGRRGVKVVKAKSAKSQGRRARRTRVRKSPMKGGIMNKKMKDDRKSSYP